MALSLKIWTDLDRLVSTKKIKEAIQLLEKELPEAETPEDVVNVGRRLAHYYLQDSPHKNSTRGAKYLFLVGEAYCALGRMAPAVAVLNQIWAVDGAEKLAQGLHQKVSTTFSIPVKRKSRGSDDDLPPPTPFQNLKGFVTFEQDDEEHFRYQWAQPDTRKAPLFSLLKASEVSALIHLAYLRDLPPQSVLFREGDAADAFYIVADGEMEMSNQRGLKKKFKEGDWFGEIALLGKLPRTATLRSLSGAQLLEFPFGELQKCFELNPTLEAKVMHFYEMRLFGNAASRHPLFDRMQIEDLEELWDDLVSIRVPLGRSLFKKGQKVDRFYLITQGSVAGYRGKDQVATWGPGNFIGPSRNLDEILSGTECHLVECHQLILERYMKDFPNLKLAFDLESPFDFFSDEITDKLVLEG